MMTHLDSSVGAIVKSLGEKDMLKNSIIIFSTDNGGPAEGFNLNAASNWPLRGVKNTLQVQHISFSKSSSFILFYFIIFVDGKEV